MSNPFVTFQPDASEDLIGMAKMLLGKTDASVGGIAAQCGYKRVEYFIKLFWEKEKITPGQFWKTAGR